MKHEFTKEFCQTFNAVIYDPSFYPSSNLEDVFLSELRDWILKDERVFWSGKFIALWSNRFCLVLLARKHYTFKFQTELPRLRVITSHETPPLTGRHPLTTLAHCHHHWTYNTSIVLKRDWCWTLWMAWSFSESGIVEGYNDAINWKGMCRRSVKKDVLSVNWEQPYGVLSSSHL